MDLAYCCTDFYAPQHERTIRWEDTDLGIEWLVPPGGAPLVSSRDNAGRSFRDSE